jgi:hypothetical protein
MTSYLELFVDLHMGIVYGDKLQALQKVKLL